MHEYSPFNGVSTMQPYQHRQPLVHGDAAFTNGDMHASKTYSHARSDAVRHDLRAVQSHDYFVQKQQHFPPQLPPQVSALSPAAAAFLPGRTTWSSHDVGAPPTPVPKGTLHRGDVSPTSHVHECMHAPSSARQHVPPPMPPGLVPTPAATAP